MSHAKKHIAQNTKQPAKIAQPNYMKKLYFHHPHPNKIVPSAAYLFPLANQTFNINTAVDNIYARAASSFT
eukprot:5978180-Ditylum_brightwellii.AAC.1